ncbi:N-acetylglucosamine-6-phosphate deacetylase [Gloeobacter kilaueensis]|uniref:N-acetylglucosamine-6-phosphate deacetylase n=1 Tax=Gloeobacter kilaueensis (strain ATCC BAA-2537 / CCAP 1431/1 / ULC 316 / JS1) TaxID=1183438 RepID=U5QR77_GLOK1|nr:N-acetylglucosamine-6-phosphate deacetylase [Gloeobacter kilaueensis]AGY60225.1 N-acetylglucosamine-6-phosphate deacetylase [Gloeobacter kilaueensis JS1]
MQQIHNARWVGDGGTYSLLVDGGRLLQVKPGGGSWSEAGRTIDLAGGWVSPGLVDLQLNGALGVEFSELSPEAGLEQLERIAAYLWSIGIAAWLPTLISVPVGKLHQAMEIIARFQPKAGRARILGVHLEGPFLNPEYEGAHMRQYLLPLTIEDAKAVLGDHSALVRLITLAPELDPDERVIPWLVERGIAVSLGHTAATFEQAGRAFDRGARLVTHIFNAQRPFHHREPGVVGAALLDRRVQCLCIPDGIHLHPATVRLLLALKGTDALIPVSDAVAPLGIADGEYDWHGLRITVQAGQVTLADGRLAGSALSLTDVLVRLIEQGDLDRGSALSMAAVAPRRALGLTVGWPTASDGDDLLFWPAHRSRPVRLDDL